MSNPIDFALVTPECGDWEALYADGKLIAEGHSLNARDVLDAVSNVFPNIFRYLSVSDEKAEEGFTEDLAGMFGGEK